MERQIIAFLKMNYTTGINEILDDTQTEERKIAKQDILNRSVLPWALLSFFSWNKLESDSYQEVSATHLLHSL